MRLVHQGCHPERSEGSRSEILRYAQNDSPEGIHCKVYECCALWFSAVSRSLRSGEVLVHSAAMIACPRWHHPATKHEGYGSYARQHYTCCPCHSDFTAHAVSASSGDRWPPGIILTAVRWYCSLLLSANQGVQLLAQCPIAVSARTVLTWVQTLGPQLAAATRRQRRCLGRRWWVDEVFCFRGKQKSYVYRALAQQRQVSAVLLREKRDWPAGSNRAKICGKRVVQEGSEASGAAAPYGWGNLSTTLRNIIASKLSRPNVQGG